MDISLLSLQGLLPAADLISAFVDSSFVGKLIVVIQLIMSIALWSIMFSKWRELKDSIRVSGEFRQFFTRTESLLGYFLKNPRSRNPLIVVYSEATCRLVAELEAQGTPIRTVDDGIGKTLSPASMAIVKGIAEESLSVQSLAVENGIDWIASFTTIAPLLGLLGTVWGVLEAFQDMGQQGSVNLASIAPSLSTAMLTTVVGLFVAIPSGGIYNILVRMVRRVNIVLDGFTDEYIGRVHAEFGGGR